jgi:hypothetical protein
LLTTKRLVALSGYTGPVNQEIEKWPISKKKDLPHYH